MASSHKYVRHGDIHIWNEDSVFLAQLTVRTFRIQRVIATASCVCATLSRQDGSGLGYCNSVPACVPRCHVRMGVDGGIATVGDCNRVPECVQRRRVMMGVDGGIATVGYCNSVLECVPRCQVRI